MSTSTRCQVLRTFDQALGKPPGRALPATVSDWSEKLGAHHVLRNRRRAKPLEPSHMIAVIAIVSHEKVRRNEVSDMHLDAAPLFVSLRLGKNDNTLQSLCRDFKD